MPCLGIFDQKCFIWVILGKNFKKNIVIFEISTLKFVTYVSLTYTIDFGYCCSPHRELVGSFGSNGNSTPISHYDTSQRLRYVYLRYMSLFGLF